MTVNLRYFFQIPAGASYYDPTTIQFDQSYFDKSIDAIKSYFLGECESVDVCVYCQDSSTPTTDGADAIRCMMYDVKNEDSFTYTLLESKFDNDDIIEKKVDMLRYILEKYFFAIYTFHTYANSDDYYLFGVDLPACRSFKYVLPKEVLLKYDGNSCFVDHCEFDAEEIATYIMPFYYQELGMHDNSSIRNNPEKLKKWSVIWFN